jgi:hypothetical protein
VRYTQALQASPTLFNLKPQDSLTRWSRRSAVPTSSLQLASLDCRSLSLLEQSQCADAQCSAGAEGADLGRFRFDGLP